MPAKNGFRQGAHGGALRTRFPAILAGVAALFAAALAPARAEPPLYVARGAHASVYFFGTLHAVRPTFTWDRRRLARVFARLSPGTDEVWTEIGDTPDRVELGQMMQSVGYDSARPLAAKIGAADFAALRALLFRNGQPADRLRVAAMRPWLAWVTADSMVVQEAGLRRDEGIEALVVGMARARGLPIHGLETPAEQIGVLSGLSDATAAALLHASLAGARSAARRLNALADAWAAGDEAALARAAGADDADPGDLRGRFLTERNRIWADRLARQLNGSGTWLVAVGAGHLLGADSVLALLRARGISVTRLSGEEE